MAKYCMYCGTDLPKKAETCARCGRVVPKQSGNALMIVGISVAAVAALGLVALLVFRLVLGGGDDKTARQRETASTTETVESDAIPESGDSTDGNTGEDAVQRDGDPDDEILSIGDLDGFGVTRNGDTVEITIPAALAENIPDELTAEEIADGFQSIAKNADGSVTYTMDEARYIPYMQEYREQVRESLSEIAQVYASIEQVAVSLDMKTVTFAVNRAEYEGSWDSLAAFGAQMAMSFYHVMAGTPEDQIAFTIDIVDADTGETFDQIPYPAEE